MKPEAIDGNGFDIHLSTWNDSHVWGASVAWIAFEKDLCTKVGIGGRIQTGHQKFNINLPGYRLHRDSGPRDLRQQIKFNKVQIALQ